MESESGRKNIKVAIIVILVVLGLLVLILVGRLIAGSSGLKIVNFGQVGSSLSSNNLSNLEEDVWTKLKSDRGTKGVGAGTDALIRVSSYEEMDVTDGREYKFLVDIDEYKVSYAVNFIIDKGKKTYESLTIGCPSFKEMKYPDSDCKGGGSGVEAIEMYLPYDFEMGSGRTVTVTSEYSNEKKSHLGVRVSICGNEEVAKEALDAVNEWIVSLGFNPDNFEEEIDEFCDLSFNWNVNLGLRMEEKNVF